MPPGTASPTPVAAQRLGDDVGREDVQVAGQRALRAEHPHPGPSRSSCATTWARRTTGRCWSTRSLRCRRRPRASVGSRSSWHRAVEFLGGRGGDSVPGCPSFEEALDDDLSVPQSWPSSRTPCGRATRRWSPVTGMRSAEIAGAGPGDDGRARCRPDVGRRGQGPSAQGRGLGIGSAESVGRCATSALDVLVNAELDRRAAAKAEKDYRHRR
jgi:hypothetical protein